VAANDTLVKLIQFYKTHPIEFVEQVIGATPTEQQKDLILSIVKPDARVAVKSCTASGKTAVLAWMTLYFLITHPDCRGICTAPTAGQLHRVFRAEVSKWLGKMKAPFNGFYEVMTEKIFLKGKKDTQFFSLVTGSAENRESFAGLHADKVVLLVDEASALPSAIFDTLLGTLSSGDTAFVLVSNPVRATGAFYELFQKESDNWELMTFTSFDSPNVDTEWIQEVKEYYGEDSDFYKMRVLGEFPVLDSAQFIPTDTVDEAMNRVLKPSEYHHFPRVLGCDVARFGDDSSIIVDRQGPKIHRIYEYRGLDTVAFTRQILEIYHKENYTAVFVDGIGLGAGVVDQLKTFHVPVIDVVVSQKSTDPKSYFNLRAQVYGKLRDWLPSASMPNDKALRTDLLALNYSYNNKLQIILESKKDLKRRGGKSPDRSDALSLTFANDIFNQTRYKVQARPVKQASYMWS